MDTQETHRLLAYVADKAENSTGSPGKDNVGAGVNNWRGSLKNKIRSVCLIMLVYDIEVQSSSTSKAAAPISFFLASLLFSTKQCQVLTPHHRLQFLGCWQLIQHVLPSCFS